MSDPRLSNPSIPPPPPSPPAAPDPRRRRTGMIGGVIALVLVLIGAAAAFVVTQGGDSAEAQPLALRFTPGQSESYAIHQTMDAHVSSDLLGDMPMQMDVTQVVMWEVTAVDPDGLATIEVSVSEASGTVNDVEIPAPSASAPPIEFVIAPDGRIVSAGGLALGGAGQMQGFGFPGMGQLTPILPDAGELVAPGDTWEKEFSQEFPFGEGTIEFSATSTYDRNETVDGREAAVIISELSVPLAFTLEFAELLETLGGDLGATGATGIDMFSDATVAYSGGGELTQTSFVDLDAQELLRSQSTGEFDISMQVGGIAGFDGTMAFSGTFTQELERR